MNDCYVPLPVACLEIGREQPNRMARRKKRQNPFKKVGPKRQIPKRKAKPFGKHNKDKYHK